MRRVLIDQAVRRIDAELADTARPPLVQVLGAPHQLRSLARALAPQGNAIVVSVSEDPSCAQRLHELNAERDLLLQGERAIVFLLSSRHQASFLRRHANDLTSVFDLRFELQDPQPGASDWLQSAACLRQEMARLHGSIDLTGLVSSEATVLKIPLDHLYVGPYVSLVDLESFGGSMLVFSPAGAGKTTLLRRITTVENASLRGTNRVVLFAELAAWFASQRDRPLSLEQWLRSNAFETPIPPEVWPSIVLLLDGLDEVPSSTLRRDVLHQASELRDRGALLIVTGRDHIADDLRERETQRWALARLSPLSRGASKELTHQIIRARHPDRPERADQIWEQLQRAEVAFHQNPLLLTFLVVLVDLRGELPSGQAELYRDLVELLLVAPYRRGKHRLRRADALRALAPLGWSLVHRGIGGLPRSELVEILTELERGRDPETEEAAQQASRRVEALVGGTALLRVHQGLVRFQHPTLAEYFAALWVIQEPHILAQVAEDPYRGVSSTVIVFCLSLVCDVEPSAEVERRLLGALLEHSKRRGRYDSKIPTLLFELLHQVGALTSSTRTEIAAAGVRVALGYKLAFPARREALRSLRRVLDQPVVQEAVLSRLRAPSRIPWADLARLAMEVSVLDLAQMGHRPSDPLLVDLLLLLDEHALGHALSILANGGDDERGILWALWINGAPTHEIRSRRLMVAASQDPSAAGKVSLGYPSRASLTDPARVALGLAETLRNQRLTAQTEGPEG